MVFGTSNGYLDPRFWVWSVQVLLECILLSEKVSGLECKVGAWRRSPSGKYSGFHVQILELRDCGLEVGLETRIWGGGFGFSKVGRAREIPIWAQLQEHDQ